MPFAGLFSGEALSTTPLYGDSYVQRSSTVVNKRLSAPPARPPRPEQLPWKRTIFEERVVEVINDDVGQQEGDAGDFRVSAYDFARMSHHSYGRVSPVSPLSDEYVSRSGSYGSYGNYFSNSHLSPSDSRNKKDVYLAEPRSLRRRPFSFESMRSAVSNYSMQPAVTAAPAASTADLKPEQLSVPYQPALIYDEYTEIAMSNPFQKEAESVLGCSRQERDYDFEARFDSRLDAIEPSRKSSQALNPVPLSRYNSRRVSQSPTPDPEETLRQLDQAWEEVKRAIAPRLGIAAAPGSPPIFRSRGSSLRPSTSHALPSTPPPPPIPSRNPLRSRVQPPEALKIDSAKDKRRLMHSTSSPSMAKAYKRSHKESLPPMPPLPLQIPAPIPASNLPVCAPAALPTPAASECGSSSRSSSSHSSHHGNGHHHHHHQHHHSNHPASSHSPVSLSSSPTSSTHRMNSQSSSEGSSSSRGRSPLTPVTEPSPVSARSFAEPVISVKPAVSPLPSPTGRGFHEPPPVAPARPARPPMVRRFSSSPYHTSNHNRGYSDTSAVVTTAIWAGHSPPSHVTQMHQGPGMARSNTLRSIAPGESAARTSYQAPVQSDLTCRVRESVVAGTNGGHVLQGSQRIVEEFEPIKIIPPPEKSKPNSPGENMPRFSNHFAGFCKGAWRLQTAQTNKAFGLRTTHRRAKLPNSTTTHTKTTTLKCSKCSFEGALVRHPATLSAAANYAPSIDYLACAEKTPRTAHGVVYRWSFLFKSHVQCRTTLRKDEMVDVENEVYACVFCCSEGKGTVCFKGAKTLCGHIAQEHASGVDLDPELKQRIGIVVARSPGKTEEWDIILPGQVWV